MWHVLLIVLAWAWSAPSTPTIELDKGSITIFVPQQIFSPNAGGFSTEHDDFGRLLWKISIVWSTFKPRRVSAFRLGDSAKIKFASTSETNRSKDTSMAQASCPTVLLQLQSSKLASKSGPSCPGWQTPQLSRCSWTSCSSWAFPWTGPTQQPVQNQICTPRSNFCSRNGFFKDVLVTD